MILKKRTFVILLSLVFTLIVGNLFPGGAKEKAELGKITTEPVTIYMWIAGGQNTDFWNSATAMYTEEHPNVTFDITVQDSDYILKNMFTVLASKPKKLDMMFNWTGTRIKKLYDDGSIMLIDPWFEYYRWDEKMLPGYRQNTIPGVGNAFFCTYYMTHSEVYYNTKIFEENGLTPPNSIDEFFTLCGKLKSAGIQPLAAGGKDGWPLHLIWNQMIARYMSAPDVEKLHMWVLDPNKSAETAEIFRSEGAVKAFQFIADLSSKEYFGKGVNALGFEEQNEYFQQGKAAMMFGFIPMTIYDTRKVVPDMPMDYFVMPPNDDFTAIPTEFMDGVVFPIGLKDDPVKQAVLADLLNKLVVDEKYITEALLKNGCLPNSKLITDPDKIVEITGEPLIAKGIADINKYGTVTITDDWIPPAMVDVYYKALQSAAQVTMTGEEAAQSMYDAAIEVLEFEQE